MEVTNMLNNDWKVRAIERRNENKALKKRIKELKLSRDNWRVKAIAIRNENDNLLKKMSAIKKKMNQINEM
jgi:hypothetical protein